jgi:hypothetical protein
MKRCLALIFGAALLLSFAACRSTPARPLQLQGDAEAFAFTGPNYDLAYYFEHHIETRSESFDLLLIAHDGFAVRIAGDDLTGCTLLYRNGWNLQSAYHPPPANIENIAQVVVISTSEDAHAVNLIDENEQTQTLTAGQLHTLEHLRALHEHGTSQINNRSATVFTTQHRVPLDLQGSSFAAMSRTGEPMFFRGQAYLLYGQNQIDLLLSDGRLLHDLVGVMASPPQHLITQLFHDALRFLEQGEQVLAVKLDGLGWNMLGYAPFIRSLNPRRALSVYPPVTPAGLASALTGATPNVHGIQGRGERTLAVEDIFEAAARLNKNSVHIGARNSFINTSLAPQLTLSDADAFMLARHIMDDLPDFLFIHFKEIDLTAHEFGPHAPQTQEIIAEIDDYVRVLVERFDGRVIIASDHGLHETEDGGNHGMFLPEDMIVPYWVR